MAYHLSDLRGVTQLVQGLVMMGLSGPDPGEGWPHPGGHVKESGTGHHNPGSRIRVKSMNCGHHPSHDFHAPGRSLNGTFLTHGTAFSLRPFDRIRPDRQEWTGARESTVHEHLPVGWEEMGLHLAFCRALFGDALLLNTSRRGRFPGGLINKLINLSGIRMEYCVNCYMEH